MINYDNQVKVKVSMVRDECRQEDEEDKIDRGRW